MSVLRFDNVSKQYGGGQQALREVSFEVGSGEMLFITGHSGAGKTTLMKLVHLAERPTRGAVLFGEKNLLALRVMNYEMRRDEHLYVPPISLLDSHQLYADFFYNHVPGSAWFFQ